MKKNNLKVNDSWPMDYPHKLRNYSWKINGICGPMVSWRKGMFDTQIDSPLFWKNLITFILEKMKWNEKVTLKDFEKFINYITSSFTVCFTDEKGFYISMKKDKERNVKFKKEKFYSFSEKLFLDEKRANKILKEIFEKSLEFYNKLS